MMRKLCSISSAPTACRYKQSPLLQGMPFRNALQYLVVPKHARTTRPTQQSRQQAQKER